MAGLKSKMLSRGRKKSGKTTSSSAAGSGAAASSSSSASAEAAKMAAITKLASIQAQSAAAPSASSAKTSSQPVDVDMDSPSNRTASTSAMATPSPTTGQAAGTGAAAADGGAEDEANLSIDTLDLTGTLEEVNEILGLVASSSSNAAAGEANNDKTNHGEDTTGLASGRHQADLTEEGETATRTELTAAVMKEHELTAAQDHHEEEEETVHKEPVELNRSRNSHSFERHEEEEMLSEIGAYEHDRSKGKDEEQDMKEEMEAEGIEVQLGQSFDAPAIISTSSDGGDDIGDSVVIQESSAGVEMAAEAADDTDDDEKEVEVEQEELVSDIAGEFLAEGEGVGEPDLSAIVATMLPKRVEGGGDGLSGEVAPPDKSAAESEKSVPVQAATEEEPSSQANASADNTGSEAPAVTPDTGTSDGSLAGTAAVAAAGAATAAAAVVTASNTPDEASNDPAAAGTAPSPSAAAKPKGPGLGVSKFAEVPALDDWGNFVSAMTASVTEAVQPGLDSVRKTLNFGTPSPAPAAAEGDKSSSTGVVAAAAAGATAAAVGATAVAAAAVSAQKDEEATPPPSPSDQDAIAQTANDDDANKAIETPKSEQNDSTLSSKASGAAKTLLAAFNCASNDTTADKVTTEGGEQLEDTSLSSPPKSPDASSLRKAEEDAKIAKFLKEITEEGIILLLHQAPNPTGSNPTSDWTQKIVRVYIKPGSGGTAQPKLLWARNKSLPLTRLKTGVPEADAGEKKIRWTSLDLLDIHSILGATDSDTSKSFDDAKSETKKGDGDEAAANTSTATEGGTADQSCFFTVTSGKGAVFVFEAMTPEERDRVSKGLRSVITGLANALITGNIDKYVALVKDTRDEEDEEGGELPSLRTPTQAMNEIAHVLLD